MKLKVLFAFMLLAFMDMSAQAPEKMSYQAIIRSSDNSLVIDAPVNLKIIVRQGSVNGSGVYEESHSATTNANGLVSLEIGAGSQISGDFSEIPWDNGPFFIETQVDPKGGSNYSIIGVSQLLSVPYALYAKYAENVSGAATGGGGYSSAAVVSLQASRNIAAGDIGNTLECTKTATVTLTSGFSDMKVGETVNLEAHNGASLTVKAASGVSLNYTEGGTANFKSESGNVRFGLLRKSGDNAYIISGQ
ncbi:hypothetical protein Q4603_17420 [Zobellia galactanivorans]|uniref:hypothetical protein n=1 Tax=Zobellia galactanivorans (strain DSM 12802 / CCUG 47099 / CIP 106680 / NCIMB 13871 / Dsij) TaxID=63186 RepID=UPI0026E332F0|nr:hypothetical protein [Zobellia galactanivorans]MDO6810406.1 hypothetical protein [Zobellia galactanivorans]